MCTLCVCTRYAFVYVIYIYDLIWLPFFSIFVIVKWKHQIIFMSRLHLLFIIFIKLIQHLECHGFFITTKSSITKIHVLEMVLF